MSTPEEPGPFDGLERAKPGEPVFTLQGGDPLGSRLVRVWVWQARKAILRDRTLTDEERAGKLIKVREAERIAEEMEAWRAGHVEEAKPAPKVPTYSGHESTSEEIEAKRVFDIVKLAAERIDNSVAECTEAAEAINGLGNHVTANNVTRAVDWLRAAADAIRPQRRSYAHRGGD